MIIICIVYNYSCVNHIIIWKLTRMKVKLNSQVTDNICNIFLYLQKNRLFLCTAFLRTLFKNLKIFFFLLICLMYSFIHNSVVLIPIFGIGEEKRHCMGIYTFWLMKVRFNRRLYSELNVNNSFYNPPSITNIELYNEISVFAIFSTWIMHNFLLFA